MRAPSHRHAYIAEQWMRPNQKKGALDRERAIGMIARSFGLRSGNRAKWAGKFVRYS
ncbi:MAG: hypothetical protein ABL921_29155 [Pirellula sp.]